MCSLTHFFERYHRKWTITHSTTNPIHWQVSILCSLLPLAPQFASDAAITCSTGDFGIKRCCYNVISNEPEFTVVQLSEDDRLLILASDGVWATVH